MAIELRYYQKEALHRIWQRKIDGERGAFLELATGGGKTPITAEVAKRTVQEGGRFLFLVEREKLIEQTRDKIIDMFPGADIGVYGFGKRFLDHSILLGGVDTLSRPDHLSKIKDIPFTVINVDEAHRANSEKYLRILSCFPNAFWFGQSATPFRQDGKNVFSVFHCKSATYKKGILDLIEEIDPETGNPYLTSFRVHMARTRIVLSGVATNGDGEYDDESLAQAIDRPDRNAIAATTCLMEEYGGPDIPSVTFAANKKHAIALMDEYNRHGIVSRAVIDITTKEECDEIFEKFARGEINMLVTVTKLTEGWDADVRRIVIAAPTRSAARFLQRLGRGSRPAPGKTHCIVIDLTDDCNEHSLEPLTVADVLHLPELSDGDDVLEAIKKRREKGETLPDEEDRQVEQQVLMNDEIIYKEKHLHKHIDWIAARGGNYLTQIGSDQIVIAPGSSGKFDIFVGRHNEAKGMREWIMKETDRQLGWAQMLAEGYAKTIEKGYGDLLDPTSAKYNEPITSGQIAKLKQLKVHIPINCTKGEASALLQKSFQRKSQPKKKKKTEEKLAG